jgi:hypothetical protein
MACGRLAKPPYLSLLQLWVTCWRVRCMYGVVPAVWLVFDAMLLALGGGGSLTCCCSRGVCCAGQGHIAYAVLFWFATHANITCTVTTPQPYPRLLTHYTHAPPCHLPLRVPQDPGVAVHAGGAAI